MTNKFHGKNKDWYLSTPVEHTFQVDGNRTDSYIENGSPTRPFKTITRAVAIATSKQTIKVMAGTYVEDLIIPAGVSLVGYALNQVTIEGDVSFEGPSSPISIKGIIFGGVNKTLTINCTCNIFESYSYSKVVFGTSSHVSAYVFNINISQTDVPAIEYNGTGDLNINGASITSKGNSNAIIINSGRLAIFDSEVYNNNAGKATVLFNGGTLVSANSQIVNATGGVSVDLTLSEATSTNPNAFGNTICVGNVTCSTKSTLVEGLQFLITGGITGTSLTFRSASMIANDSAITGDTVKDALDNLVEKNGISGSFTTVDGKTVTVVDGQITNIV